MMTVYKDKIKRLFILCMQLPVPLTVSSAKDHFQLKTQIGGNLVYFSENQLAVCGEENYTSCYVLIWHKHFPKACAWSC